MVDRRLGVDIERALFIQASSVGINIETDESSSSLHVGGNTVIDGDIRSILITIKLYLENT